jgi:hypothetical protein
MFTLFPARPSTETSIESGFPSHSGLTLATPATVSFNVEPGAPPSWASPFRVVAGLRTGLLGFPCYASQQKNLRVPHPSLLGWALTIQRRGISSSYGLSCLCRGGFIPASWVSWHRHSCPCSWVLLGLCSGRLLRRAPLPCASLGSCSPVPHSGGAGTSWSDLCLYPHPPTITDSCPAFIKSLDTDYSFGIGLHHGSRASWVEVCV